MVLPTQNLHTWWLQMIWKPISQNAPINFTLLQLSIDETTTGKLSGISHWQLLVIIGDTSVPWNTISYCTWHRRCKSFSLTIPKRKEEKTTMHLFLTTKNVNKEYAVSNYPPVVTKQWISLHKYCTDIAARLHVIWTTISNASQPSERGGSLIFNTILGRSTSRVINW